ncbi:hypothetical protein [Priestia megaterium]|uniref:hypothetical protein n=1 Tax=Priestia megaterium TaxID=1404 RepID=UPI002B251D0A|nr:hypothetical protein [Priestia megaterium]MEE3895015.1 hypothetical protein [Priestia megaterium]
MRTIITADARARKNTTSMTTMATANVLARKNAISMTTMATANVLARKNAISMTTMIHVMRKNIIVKTDVTMITALFFFNRKTKITRLFH